MRKNNFTFKSEKIVYYYQKRLKKSFQERVRISNLLTQENKLRETGHLLIAGIDEVGRGALAGPVIASAVILPELIYIPNIRDSKRLSPRQRLDLYRIILEKAITIGIGIVHAYIIDQINIQQATFIAMKKAIKSLKSNPNYILVDGFKIPQLDIPQLRFIRGEEISISIACASIVAKVYRDNLMYYYHQKYPLYHFEQNKGYGTREHLLALKKYGASEIHRKTYKGVGDISIFDNGEDKLK